MTDYNEILDTEIDPESPITTSLMTRLRDNPIAIVEGAPGAPKVSPSILSIAGTELDGAFDNTFAPTLMGFYDLEGGTRSTSLTLPPYSFIRIRGDFTLSNTLTVDSPDATEAAQMGDFFGCIRGNEGDESLSAEGAGGGGSIGDGGDHNVPSLAPGGSGKTAATSATSKRSWAVAHRFPITGGRGGRFGAGNTNGGGVAILFIEGDFICTGGVINADGDAGVDASTNGGGGGGGGTVIVICTGTITDGTFRARGGDGGHGASCSSGGGGGGLVVLVASAFSGSQTTAVTGGNHTPSGSEDADDGASGYAHAYTATAQEIGGFIWR